MPSNDPVSAYLKTLVGEGTTAIIDFAADTVKLALLDTGAVTPNRATDDFYNDWSAGVVGTPVILTGITYPSPGVVDCNDPTFTGVSGATVEAMFTYKDTGSPTTSPLAVLYEVFTSGMPLTPNGGDVAATINASGLQRIGS